jgi:O-antigen ligase
VVSLIDFEDIRKDIAKPISKIAPRISEFISGEGIAGDLDHDRSWLLRELMIEKGIEIVYKHPLLGVGLFNFANYDAKLNSLYEDEKFYSVLYGQVNNADKFNNKSAHNSYIQLISENGIIGFSLYILLAFPLIYVFLKKLIFSEITLNDLPLMSFFFLSIYFYAIASLMGTLTYVIIGMAIASKNKQIKF